MQLKELQQAFVAALPFDSTSAGSAIVDNTTFGGELGSTGMFIYRNNRQQALRQTLAQHYPTVQHLLGREYFNHLTRQFIAQHPPHLRDLNHYGGNFPQWLANQLSQRDELISLPYLDAVAALDHALHCSYYAPNRRPWPASDFAALPEQQQSSACLQLARDIHLLYSQWPIDAIKQCCEENTPLDLSSQAISSQERKYYFLIHRDNYRPTLTSLSPSSYRLALQLQQNTPLCDLGINDAIVKYAINQTLPDWIQHGWIDDFQLASPIGTDSYA